MSDPFSVIICHLTVLEISKHSGCEVIVTMSKISGLDDVRGCSFQFKLIDF